MTHQSRIITFTPRLLRAAEAAHYLGISESTLRSLDLPRRILGAKRLYDRIELDAYASDLPHDGEPDDEANTCDQAWGETT